MKHSLFDLAAKDFNKPYGIQGPSLVKAYLKLLHKSDYVNVVGNGDSIAHNIVTNHHYRDQGWSLSQNPVVGVVMSVPANTSFKVRNRGRVEGMTTFEYGQCYLVTKVHKHTIEVLSYEPNEREFKTQLMLVKFLPKATYAVPPRHLLDQSDLW